MYFVISYSVSFVSSGWGFLLIFTRRVLSITKTIFPELICKQPGKYLLLNRVSEQGENPRTTRCPQQRMKQQSAWLLNHISTYPIKQWENQIGAQITPQSTQSSYWINLAALPLTSHSSWPRIHDDSRKVESRSLSPPDLCRSAGRRLGKPADAALGRASPTLAV